MTDWSQGEVESLARKAARGAGRSWGMAEEAGRAVRWLNERGQPGAAILADLLRISDGRDHAALIPDCRGDDWTAKAQAICPLVLGCALSDRAADLALPMAAGPVLSPLLLAPFLSDVARHRGQPVRLEWDTAALCITEADLCVISGAERMADTPQARVAIAALGQPMGQAQPCTPRAQMTDGTRTQLEALAARTYAPDTPERRLSGAGAGLQDND